MALRNKVHERKIFDTPYFLSNQVNFLKSSYFGAKSLKKGGGSILELEFKQQKFSLQKIFQLSPEQEPQRWLFHYMLIFEILGLNYFTLWRIIFFAF